MIDEIEQSQALSRVHYLLSSFFFLALPSPLSLAVAAFSLRRPTSGRTFFRSRYCKARVCQDKPLASGRRRHGRLGTTGVNLAKRGEQQQIWNCAGRWQAEPGQLIGSDALLGEAAVEPGIANGTAID